MDSNVSTGLVLVHLFFFLIEVVALLRCAMRPRWAFEAALRSKTLWLILLIVGLFLPLLGYVFALWYLFSTDRAVRNQMQLGRGPGFPGGAPQY
jgi:hypothetical protein